MKNVNSRFVVPAVLVAVAGLTAAASGQLVFNPIALSGTDGQYGPGMGAGATFLGGTFATTPVINSQGQVAFRGNLVGTGSGIEGMWISGGGANTNVGIAGGARPGGGTYPTGSGVFSQFMINDSSEWFARVGASTGVVATSGATSTRMAYAGDVAPGSGAANFATGAVASGHPYINNAGQTAFIGNLAVTAGSSPTVVISGATANGSGIWMGTAASGANLLLRQNDTSSLFDAGQTAGESRLGGFQTASMGFNNNGHFVVSANLQGTNIITAVATAGQNNGVILSNRSGSLEVIARAGTVAPDTTGAPSSLYFRGTASTGLTSSAIGFNDSGRVAFVGGLRDSGTTQVSTQAIFTDAGGPLHLVARNGTAMPTIYNRDGSVNTTVAGANWAGFGAPMLNSTNTLVFQAQSNTVASMVLTVDTAGRFTTVMQSATVAIPGGAPLGGDAMFGSASSNIEINRWNQMIFTCTLSGAGIFGGPGGNNQSFWAYDPTLGMHLLARTQDPFTVAPGDIRTINAIGGPAIGGGQDGRQSSLNDSGVVALTLHFTDGSSGVFTVAIPALGAAAALGLGGLAAVRRKRR